MSAPQFKTVRSRRSRDLTLDLADILRIFCKKDKFQWFCQNMEENCVKPAMALYEKIQVSTHHFYLDIQPYIAWSGSRFSLSPEFVENVEKLDCRNILQNRKAFNMAKLDPRPTKKDLYLNLFNVCTVVPPCTSARSDSAMPSRPRRLCASNRCWWPGALRRRESNL